MGEVNRMTRRTFLPVLGSAAVALRAQEPAKPKGRLKQGVTAGVFRGKQMSLDDMCREAANLGIYGFDLVKPQDWPILKSMDWCRPRCRHRSAEQFLMASTRQKITTGLKKHCAKELIWLRRRVARM